MNVYKYASQQIVCQYQPWGPNTEQETQDFVTQVILDAKKDKRSRLVFSIVNKSNNRMIGAGEINIHDFQNREGEIGYIVNPAYWGKGIATEAAKLLIEFGFDQLNLHRIFATCDPRNIESSRVLEKIGMIKEGRIRD
ncbi:GNAT family N-acetyltransferase [Rummeliibacillus pycnus]|uniref:GNAT family N-acetyltransferase n=1 Tax=Rummeliibacillus pycnus TaxID=101070 RepID=UPI003D280629